MTDKEYSNHTTSVIPIRPSTRLDPIIEKASELSQDLLSLPREDIDRQIRTAEANLARNQQKTFLFRENNEDLQNAVVNLKSFKEDIAKKQEELTELENELQTHINDDIIQTDRVMDEIKDIEVELGLQMKRHVKPEANYGKFKNKLESLVNNSITLIRSGEHIIASQYELMKAYEQADDGILHVQISFSKKRQLKYESSTDSETSDDDIMSLNNQRWTELEKTLFQKAYLEYGRKWKAIASSIKTRTAEQVRAFAKSQQGNSLIISTIKTHHIEDTWHQLVSSLNTASKKVPTCPQKRQRTQSQQTNSDIDDE